MTNHPRPLSPHLQVYRPQLTSVLSILHRLTGLALAAGAGLMTWWLLAAADSAEAFATFHAFAGSLPGKAMLLGWLFSFVYHFLNGIRHLVWDTGRWLELKSAYASGYAVVAGSLVFTALIWHSAG